MKFIYPAEKFSVARRLLMLPFRRTEADIIASVFHECTLGLHDIHEDDPELDQHARDEIQTLKQLMDTSGIDTETGRWAVKAQQLTHDEKRALSDAVDSLATWFYAKCR